MIQMRQPKPEARPERGQQFDIDLAYALDLASDSIMFTDEEQRLENVRTIRSITEYATADRYTAVIPTIIAVFDAHLSVTSGEAFITNNEMLSSIVRRIADTKQRILDQIHSTIMTLEFAEYRTRVHS